MEDKLIHTLIIDENCRVEIDKTYKQVRNYSILYLIWSTLMLIRYSIKVYNSFTKNYDTWINIFYVKIFPIAFILQLILTIFNINYYYQAFKKQRDAVMYNDKDLFSSSFSIIRKANFLSLITFILTICYTLVIIYNETK